jgi:hypothetical protein
MGEMKLHERTYQILQEPLLGNQDVDTKVRLLVEAEYLRRLAAYHHTDNILARKYGMSFAEFVQQKVVEQKEFAWSVESDAMDWETEIGGIKTIERKLEELRKISNE